jgi:hypothetical protein
MKFPDQFVLGAFEAEQQGAPLDLFRGKAANPMLTGSERNSKEERHVII